jgi:WD40 repeat protein
MHASNRTNPFPGLRPFNQDEAHLFFGRDRHSDDLVRRLARRRFLAIVGTSGSGKSSLVRAGLVPSLESGLMAEAGTRWRIATFRPQDDPIGFLARAIVETGALEHLDIAESAANDVIETTLRRSSLGLVEAARLARLSPNENMLVLVDQFEELFRFADLDKDASRADDAPAFVKLLLEATRQPDMRLYVVITMRSDFLGDCARFRDLPEAISDGQFLIPRLTRDELNAAITGPIGVSGGRIAPELVQDLLNAIGDDMDQLPVLQHALMRAWDHWYLVDEAEHPMDRGDLTAIGGLSEALSRHAEEEAFGSLETERERRIAQCLFKSLTERGLDNREVRRPTPLAGIASIAGVRCEEIVPVIETFRAPKRAFLMPPHGVELSEETVIDISHESLIRQWARLRAWVAEEADSRAMYLRLVEAARLWKAGKGGLWGEPDLTYARQWQEREAPNAPWAERYAPGFDEAMAFLRASEDAHRARLEEERQRADAERAAKERELEQAKALAEAQRQRADVQAAARRRQTIFSIALVVLLIAGPMIAFYAWQQRGQAEYQGRISLARQFASQSQLVREQQPDAYPTALLLAIEAVERSPMPLLEANQAVRSLIAVMPRPVIQLENVNFRGGDLKISPDGRTVAWYDQPGEVTLWSVGAAPADRRKLAEKYRVNYMEFSANSQRLVAGSATSLRIWRVADGVLEREIASLKNAAAAGVSDDGRHVAILRHDGMVQVWNEGPAAVTEIRLAHSAASPGPGRFGVVRFSPGGEYLAMGAYNRVMVCRVGDWLGCGSPLIDFPFGLLGFSRRSEDGALALTVFGPGTFRAFAISTSAPAPLAPGFNGMPSGKATALALSPNGRLAAPATESESGGIWDLYHGEVVADLPGGADTRVLAFSPDSTKLVMGNADRTVQVWDITSRREIARMAHGEGARSVAFTPDGTRVVAATYDSRITVWEAAGESDVGSLRGEPVTRRAPLVSNRASVGQVEITIAERESQSRPSGDEPPVREALVTRWRPNDGAVTKVIDGWIQTPHLSENGRRLWAARGESAIAWDVGTLTAAATFEHQPQIDWAAVRSEQTQRNLSREVPFRLDMLRSGGSVKILGTSPDGEFAATNRVDQTARLWRVGSPAPIATFQHEANVLDEDAVRAVFSAGGRYVAFMWRSVTKGENLQSKWDVRLFELPNGKEVAHTSLALDDLVSTEISPDESLINFVDVRGQLVLLELPSLRERWRDEHRGIVRFSPDSRFIAMTPRRADSVAIVQTGTKTAVTEFKTSGEVTSIMFSPDGELFAMGNERGQVLVGQTRNGRTIASLTHVTSIRALAFTPDSSVLASASDGGTTRLLDCQRGVEITRVTARGTPRNLRFSADGKFLITEASNDVQVWLWRARDLVEEACPRLTTDLTPEQWRTYLGDQPPIACRARFMRRGDSSSNPTPQP